MYNIVYFCLVSVSIELQKSTKLHLKPFCLNKQVSQEVSQFLSFKKGEEKGFAYFFNLYYPRICFFAIRLLDERVEAEDITEEAFIKLWGRREQFESPEAIKNFLYLVARNACFDFLRQDKRQNSRNEA